jgi:NADPH:quinone reductase-like Zn-dependent oxidoreductase
MSAQNMIVNAVESDGKWVEEKMKAIVYTQYGSPDVLQLKEVAKPEPKDNQVLVQIHAASANALDYRRFEKLSAMGRFMEERLVKSAGKVLGADIAGVVQTVGANVKQFKPGDAVFGIAAGSAGGFAEYACAGENNLVLKPARQSFQSAAAVPVAGLTALQGLRDKGQIQPGQKVLIVGASGGVGTFAVQIAKALGAQVTAVCSPRNLDMARSIGADDVIDYTKEDFTQNDQRYDLIFAVNGFHSLAAYQRALNPQGSYVCAGGTLAQIFQAMLLGSLMSRKNGTRMSFMGISKPNRQDLLCLAELVEAGKIVPVIEKCYALNEVPSAMRYLTEGHARGKVVIQIGE